MPAEVHLTRFEQLHACLAGAQRQLEALAHYRPNAHGFTGRGWDAHIEGAGAELAVARVINRYWDAVVEDPRDLGGDVGDGIQVRSTRHRNGSLIVHPKDDDEAVFILVTGAMPSYLVVGWIRARAAKQDEYWSEPQPGRPCYMVPQDKLLPLEHRR